MTGRTEGTSQNLLSVATSQLEDEGYLSPSDEDLIKSINNQRGYLDCSNSSDQLVSKYRRVKSAGWAEDIPWEKFMTLPNVQEEQKSWDRLKLPVPYRFYDDHQVCLRQVRKASKILYLTDSIEKQAKVVESIWKLGDPKGETRLAEKVREGDGTPTEEGAVAVIKSTKDPVTYISTQQFVKDVFSLLCGCESITFSKSRESQFAFSKNPRVLVQGLSPGVLVKISSTFLDAGKTFNRLNYISAMQFDEKLIEKEGLGGNPVFTAFLKFTAEHLKLYQTCLMLELPKIRTISSLKLFYKPFHAQLQALEYVLDLYISTDQITLLKGLNSMMLSCETPCIADLIRSAFTSCAAAYLRYVSQWIFKGQIAKGFHIQKTKSSIYFDRRYWIKQFAQVASVPTFMEDAVNIIFETGKSINLIELIGNSDQKSPILSCVLHADSSVIRPAVNFKEIYMLEKEWNIKTDSFYEEYSFLETNKEAELCRFKEAKKSVDFDLIEEAKQSFKTKNLESRKNLQDKKTEKQRELYNLLTAQVEAKKSRQNKEKEDEILENEKILLHMKTQDERDLQEEIRLMKKHFDGRTSETVGLRNVRERIAALPVSSVVSDGGDKPLDLNSSLVNTNDENENPVEEEEIIKNPLYDENLDMENKYPDDKLGIVECISDKLKRKDSLKSQKRVTFDASMSNGDKEVLFKIDCAGESIINSCPKPNDVDEDKFNPDNVVVPEPIPYNLNLDFEALATGVLSKSLLHLSTSNSTLSTSQQHNSHESYDEENTWESLRHDSFCLNFFFNQSVTIPVTAQNRMINSALLHYFIVEKRLFSHVEALNSYLCLQNGLFGHFLTNMLIKEVKSESRLTKEDIPRKANRLNQLLGEAVLLSLEGKDTDIRDHLGFILTRESSRNSMDLESQKSVKSKALSSPYEMLDDVTINYSVDWPLNILLTDELLINYEKLFNFQMSLYRAEMLLLGLSSILKFKGSKSKQIPILHHYRWRMLHFVRTVRHYINVTVIHSAWTELASSFHRMDSLEKVYEGLVRHIKFVTTNCLLGAKGEAVKKLLLNQLTVIECFCTEVEDCAKAGISWDAGEEIHPRRFAKLDQKFKVWEEIQKVFIQVFFKLATRGTYQKVSYFLQLFNFNSYFSSGIVE